MQDVVLDKLYQLLAEVRPEVNFKEITDFVEGGIFDSLDIIMLVSTLQDTFSISIDGVKITPEYFNSIEGLAALVAESESAD